MELKLLKSKKSKFELIIKPYNYHFHICQCIQDQDQINHFDS